MGTPEIPSMFLQPYIHVCITIVAESDISNRTVIERVVTSRLSRAHIMKAERESVVFTKYYYLPHL